jgi:polysaccharide export outer membrane protein
MKQLANSGSIVLFLIGILLGLAGCQSSPPPFQDTTPAQQGATKSDVLILREGDVVRVAFPGAPSLNTASQPIRRDGRLSLPIIGDFKAVGLTPAEMEKELIKLYGNDLQTKEVTVMVESSALQVYVTGAVLKPGKILADHPLTALEAIMEAGGFDPNKANMKKVKVLRRENDKTQTWTLNLKRVIDGQENDRFRLKPADMIFVPERFVWF